MINKNQYTISNDKKVLHKVGKNWVTLSALTLAVLGGAEVAGHATKVSANSNNGQSNSTQNATNTQASTLGSVQTSNVNVQPAGVQPQTVQQNSVGVQSTEQSAQPVQQPSDNQIAPSAEPEPSAQSSVQSSVQSQAPVQQSAVESAQPQSSESEDEQVQQPNSVPSSSVSVPSHASSVNDNSSVVHNAPLHNVKNLPKSNFAKSAQSYKAPSLHANVAKKSLAQNGISNVKKVIQSNSANPIHAIQNNAKQLHKNIMVGAMQQGNNNNRPEKFSIPKVNTQQNFTAQRLIDNLQKMPMANPANREVKSANKVDFGTDRKQGVRQAYLGLMAGNHGLKLDANDSDTDTLIFVLNNENGEDVASDYPSGADGTTGEISDKMIPSGYTLASGQSRKFKYDGGIHLVIVNSNGNSGNESDDVDVIGNPVTFNGSITLHFHDGKGNTIQNISLPYSIQTKTNMKINDLLNSTNPSVTIPADYLNRVINKFNTSNFTYDNNIPMTKYDGIVIAAQDAKNKDGNTLNNGNITFSFTSKQVPEKIHFTYNNHNEGNTTMNGQNDTPGVVPTNNTPGVNPGWHVDPKNDHFKYSDGNANVPVLPNQVSDIIHYVVSDNRATNNNQVVGTYTTKKGNDYRATDAGNNTVTINGNDNVPTGYHIVPNKNLTFGYDGKVHAVSVIGNSHNGGKKDLTPSNTRPTTPSDQSDIVAVHEQEYANNKYIRTVTQYVAESGLTGESYTVNPNSFIPNGYATDPNDKDYTGQFTANGINNKDVTWRYDAKQGQTVNVAYINQHGATVESGQISGEVDTTGNVYDSVDKQGQKLAMPKGYHFVSASDDGQPINGANGNDVNYTISLNGQNINIHVQGNAVNPHHEVHINHPTTPSDTPGKPTQPSDIPNKPVNPNKPYNPKTNPANPTTPSDDKPAYPSDANDTFYIQINDWNGKTYNHRVRSYVKRMTIDGKSVGDSFTVKPNTFMPKGYHMTQNDKDYTGSVSANGLVNAQGASNNLVVFNYDANDFTMQIHYVPYYIAYDADTGQPTSVTNSPAQSPIPQSDDNGGNNTVNTQGDSDINANNYMPQGYHVKPGASNNIYVNPNDPAQQTANVPVVGNWIHGDAHLIVNYKESNGNESKGITDDSSDQDLELNSAVGDKPTVINPWNYHRQYYSNHNQKWVIPYSYHIAPNGPNTNYNVSDTFTYWANTANNIIVDYVDMDKGAVSDGHGTDKSHHPIISDQNITNDDLGGKGIVTGKTIELGAKGANDGNGVKDVLQIPVGYHLVSKINPLVIHMNRTLGSQPIILMVGLTRQTTPVQPQKPVQPTNNIVDDVKFMSNGQLVASTSVSGGTDSAISTSDIMKSLPQVVGYQLIKGNPDAIPFDGRTHTFTLDKKAIPSDNSNTNSNSDSDYYMPTSMSDNPLPQTMSNGDVVVNGKVVAHVTIPSSASSASASDADLPQTLPNGDVVMNGKVIAHVTSSSSASSASSASDANLPQTLSNGDVVMNGKVVSHVSVPSSSASDADLPQTLPNGDVVMNGQIVSHVAVPSSEASDANLPQTLPNGDVVMNGQVVSHVAVPSSKASAKPSSASDANLPWTLPNGDVVMNGKLVSHVAVPSSEANSNASSASKPTSNSDADLPWTLPNGDVLVNGKIVSHVAIPSSQASASAKPSSASANTKSSASSVAPKSAKSSSVAPKSTSAKPSSVAPKSNSAKSASSSVAPKSTASSATKKSAKSSATAPSNNSALSSKMASLINSETASLMAKPSANRARPASAKSVAPTSVAPQTAQTDNASTDVQSPKVTTGTNIPTNSSNVIAHQNSGAEPISRVSSVSPRVAVSPSAQPRTNHELPQTGDNAIDSMASILMVLSSLTLAGADLDKKRRARN